MSRLFFALTTAALCSPHAASAALIDGTSFESEPIGGLHTDPAMDGSLLALDAFIDTTNAGGGTVDSVTGTELGFNLTWHNSRFGEGFSEGDFVGVTDRTQNVGAYTSGDRGYEISDPDGRARLGFDQVDLTHYKNVVVSLDLFVTQAAWNTNDQVRIYVDTNEDNYVLVDTTGLDIDDKFGELEGQWTSLSVEIPDAITRGSLQVRFSGNADAEAIYLDTVRFDGDLVPEPSSLALIGLGGLLALRRHRA